MPGECQWLYGVTMCDHFDHLSKRTGRTGKARMAQYCEKFR